MNQQEQRIQHHPMQPNGQPHSQQEQQRHPIQNYLLIGKTAETLPPNHFSKALPSPSPLVTPEMGERLCRMSSQHHLSDYNRFKRTPQPTHNTHEQEAQKQHRSHRHHHHHHHHHQQQQQQPQPPLESIPILTTLLPLPTIINQDPSLDQAPPISYHTPNPALKPPTHPISNSQPIPIPAEPESTRQPPLFTDDPTPPPLDENSIRSQLTPHASLPTDPIDPALAAASPPHPQPQSSSTTSHSHHALAKLQSVKTSQTHPMNISPVIPAEFTAALMFMLKTANHRAGSNKLPIDLFDLTGAESEKAIELFWQYYHQRLANLNNQRGHHDDDEAGAKQGSAAEAGGSKLGNLLLSSCPGKKVRMNETAAQRQATGNHRSPICRDLKSDLSRAHSIGIRAIICCLDDEELEYLGSPWGEYSRISQECGLSVIRIPIAEGFAPQKGIKEVNEVLDQVIKNYTVQGIDVLCHCRGGVGRAGLVACCWMLKIGLINKPSLIADPNSSSPIHSPHHPHHHHHNNDNNNPPIQPSFGSSNYQDQFTFQAGQQHPPPPVPDIFSFVDGHQLAPKNSVLGQVEKVIEVIRRRRSAKAIETPQQVHFIIQYAHWLDTLTENVDLF
ncbi:hypothetical protein PCASD_21793 [Puccinia coronata f. sp. avenae]|uniref:Tyrosine specific protein phosphatases domain-containing protein n=1 Tax=Puccinia coronata f. sp. avenae TaxID=200324 RepID=A0A2N5SXK2_9BASI|nr:hypothetical protein PCASD_21793 [Puccinia coronata f. sp. avenae]